MKTIGCVFLFLILPCYVFSQNNLLLNSFSENIINVEPSNNIFSFDYASTFNLSQSNHDTIFKIPKDIFIENIFPFGFLFINLSLSIIMREWIYNGNHQNNWWGNVNGALTMGFAGVITSFILFLPAIAGASLAPGADIDIIPILVTGFIIGASLSFIPSVQQTFRENAFAYYATPVILFVVSIPGFISGLNGIKDYKISKKVH